MTSIEFYNHDGPTWRGELRLCGTSSALRSGSVLTARAIVDKLPHFINKNTLSFSFPNCRMRMVIKPHSDVLRIQGLRAVFDQVFDLQWVFGIH